MCLLAWALHIYNHSKAEWKRRVGKEVSSWLQSDFIQFGLVAKTEIGEVYF